MGYSIQNFKKGLVLEHTHLINIENGIISNENNINKLKKDIQNSQNSNVGISNANNFYMIPSPIDETIYSGGSIACIGDSITAGVGANNNPYHKQLGELLNMSVTNLGSSGTVLCTGGHRSCRFSALSEENCKDKAIVTILLGINDWDQARNNEADGCYYYLGDMDSEDTSCIYGAMKMWCNKIVELKQTDSCANTKFYFMTPVITSWNNSAGSKNWDQNKTNVHGFKLRDLCQAIIDVCALYKIPVIDLNLYSGIYYNSSEDNNTKQYGGDGIHVNEGGHTLIANAILKALKQNPTYKSEKESTYYILDYISKMLKTDISYPSTSADNFIIPIKLKEILLSQSSIEINAGETANVEVSFNPSNTTQTNIVWSSSNTSIAIVNEGVITGVSEGETTIICKSSDNPSISSTINIKVNKPISGDITGISISGPSEVRVGRSIVLTASLVPSSTNQTDVEWSSDNTNISTVNGNGLTATVTGISVGQSYITCRSISNPSVYSEYFITINEQQGDIVDLSTILYEKTSDVTYNNGSITSTATGSIINDTVGTKQTIILKEPLVAGQEIEVEATNNAKKFHVIGLNDENTLESLKTTACYGEKIMATPINLYFDPSNSDTIMSFESSDSSLNKPVCSGDGSKIEKVDSQTYTIIFKRDDNGNITVWQKDKGQIIPPADGPTASNPHTITTQWNNLNSKNNTYLCIHGIVNPSVSYKIKYFGKLRQ
jgi:uncharacterized protein YjdB